MAHSLSVDLVPRNCVRLASASTKLSLCLLASTVHLWCRAGKWRMTRRWANRSR